MTPPGYLERSAAGTATPSQVSSSSASSTRDAGPTGAFSLIIAAPDGDPCARLGIVASKNLAERSDARRLIREVFRTTTPVECPLDVVVIPKRRCSSPRSRPSSETFA